MASGDWGQGVNTDYMGVATRKNNKARGGHKLGRREALKRFLLDRIHIAQSLSTSFSPGAS